MTKDLKIMFVVMGVIVVVALIVLSACGKQSPDQSDWQQRYDTCVENDGTFIRLPDGWECVQPRTEKA